MSTTWSDLLTNALAEIRVARAGDVVNADDLALASYHANLLLDLMNADGRALFATAFQTFTLTPSLQPHTVGLSANTPTFSVSVGRPTRILQANIILSTNVRVSLGDPLTDAEWNAITAGAAAGQTPNILTSVPQNLYYSADWPNGSIYLWPVPNAANGLEIEYETLLASVALTDTFSMPQGYLAALHFTLAEYLAPSFGQQASQETKDHGRKARGIVWGNNDVVPVIQQWPGGMPSDVRRGGFNFLSGQCV